MPTEILNYVIVRKIGEGGMGQVFLARNKSIHQFVAIKMLHPRFCASPALRDRFRQEAILLSSLDHPNIVKFLNYVENDQGIFLIMEYVDGITLEDFINKKNGLIVESRAYPMMTQILDAFAYAHGRGMVHRDIKPGNIFVGKDGNIKVLDFGIARIMSEAETEGVKGVGTVEYMSPEQTLDRPLDIRSDIYSLGVLFYQMLTGRSPYDKTSHTPLEIKKYILEKPLGRMKAVYPYISDEIQALVDRATSKNPDARFHDCREMKSELLRVRQLTATRTGVLPSDETYIGTASQTGGKKSRKGVMIAIVSTITVLVAGGAGYWLYTRDYVRNYTDYTEIRAIPEGAGTSVSSIVDGDTAYRFTYSGGKLMRMSLVDAKGNVVNMADSLYALYRPVDTEFHYDSERRLDYKNIYDAEGKLLYKVDYDQDFAKARVESMQGDSTVIDLKLVFDDPSGKLSSVYYLDVSGKKTARNGVYGESYSYDRSGRLTRITFLNAENEPGVDERGVEIIGFDYPAGSRQVRSSLYDAAGKPVEGKHDVKTAPTGRAAGYREKKTGTHHYMDKKLSPNPSSKKTKDTGPIESKKSFGKNKSIYDMEKIKSGDSY